MQICVIGCGYVGLVTSAVFADLGNDIVCVDIDEERIETLRSGGCPIFEPGLPELLERNMREGRIEFTTSTPSGVERSEIIFIFVGTPPNKGGETDLSQVESAAKEIAGALNGHKIVVTKSTVPVGTGDFVRKTIESCLEGTGSFDVVSNPEFLREGQAIQDTLRPDRIVIGASSEEPAARLIELYRPLDCPVLVTDILSAEIIKYASNAFLATKISFINAVANLCEESGADVKSVARGMGSDKRIGPSFIEAGLGYGGSCFPKDLESLIHTSIELGARFRLLEEVTAVNEDRVSRFAGRIVERLGEGTGRLEGKTIAILGLAFKPDTDDMREAKSVEICRYLLGAGARLRAYDPIAAGNARKILGEEGIDYCKGVYDAAEGADAAVIVTEWREFIQLNLGRLRDALREPIIFDGRNIYSPEQVARAGIEYHSIGRPTAFPGEGA
ncbi:MAG: UDP-glucose/GDP-mannose dehydrogenase family protein [bacterium]